MTIRKAAVKDSEAIASLLLLAMEDIIFAFIGDTDSTKAFKFLHHFLQLENNQYSYQNCFIAEQEGKIVGTINIYDGSKLEILRSPIRQYIEAHFNIAFYPEDETQAGEFYIDSFGVDPLEQGKGIGATLLKFAIDHFVIERQKTLGLLVDSNNPSAKRLYLKIGFKHAGTTTLVGKNMAHLQFNPE